MSATPVDRPSCVEPAAGLGLRATGGRNLGPLLTPGLIAFAVLTLVVLAPLFVTNQLLFHSVAEMLAVVVASGIFLVTWATRDSLDNGTFQVLGAGYLCMALLDLAHEVSVPGLGVASDASLNLSAQFRVAARAIEASSLAIAAFLVERRARSWLVLLTGATLTVVLFLGIAVWPWFPTCIAGDRSPTLFNRGAELILGALLTTSIVGIFLHWRRFARQVAFILVIAIILRIASGLLISGHPELDDPLDAFGHYLKILAFAGIYQALFQTAVSDPTAVLFRGLRSRVEAVSYERDHLYAILDSMVDPICVIDADHRAVFVNQALRKTFGPLPEDGTFYHQTLHGSVDACVEGGTPLLQRGEPTRRRVVIGERSYDLIETALTLPDGRVDKLAIYRDLTDVERANAESERQRNRFRDLFETMVEGVTICDLITDAAGRPIDFCFVEVNVAFETVTGLGRAEMLGRTAREVMPGIESDPADWIGRFGRIALAGGSERFEARSQRLGRWLSVSVLAQGGSRFCTVFEDVTVRRQAELDARSREQALQVLVTDLERTRLDQQRAHESLEAFSAMVSHDLRAPLRLVAGSVELLGAGVGNDAAAREHCDRIASGVQRMERLIEDLLRLAHVACQDLHVEDVDLGILARQIFDRFAAQEPGRRADLGIDGDLMVHADPGLMAVLMQNLLVNAWKYTSDRDQTLIAVGAGSDDQGRFYYVSDNGIGFAMEHAGRLFKPFVRLHGQDRHSGSGIGLSIVRRVVERHGGSVWASSAPGQGAVFSFRLGVVHSTPPGQACLTPATGQVCLVPDNIGHRET